MDGSTFTAAPLETAGARRPVIFIYGNCNAEAMGFYLNQMTDLPHEYEIVLKSSFSSVPNDDPSVSDALERAEIVWSQLDPSNPMALSGRTRADCQVITFPPCNSKALWPFGAVDPVNCAEIDYPYGQFPYGDTVLMQLADRAGIHHANVEDAYEEEISRRKYDVLSQYEHDMHTRENRDRASDIKLFDFFNANWMSQPLLGTYNHPKRSFLEHLFFQLLDATDAVASESVRHAHHRTTFLKPDFEPFGDNEVPVSATISEIFGLDWHSGDRLYACNGLPTTAAEYYGRYLDFRRRSRGQAASASGRPGQMMLSASG